MALLKDIASEDMRDFRTRGFVLASATMDGDSLCGSAKSRAKLQKGEVVIYVDHERLLIKVTPLALLIKHQLIARHTMTKATRKISLSNTPR